MSDTKILHWKTALYRQATIKNRRAVAVPIPLKRQISRKSTLYRLEKIKKIAALGGE